MSPYDPPASVVREVVARALAEDLGILGDITTTACVSGDRTSVAVFVSRAEGVLAGTALAAETFRSLDDAVDVKWEVDDGDAIVPRTEIGRVSGSLRTILAGERTALNFLTHCSGIASLTERYVAAAGRVARVRDTRKTLPGLRAVQKAAVRAGGGYNHRESLSDAVLVKDNHLTALGISAAVERARSCWPGRIVEVECDTLEQVAEVCEARADIVLLDNMSPETVAAAVALVAGRLLVEVSGGVTLDNIAAYAHAGADFVSVGALTHSAPALDIGLDVL